MEQKHKILDSSSCEGEGRCRSRKEDRFSGLPDGVAYRILSFLTIKDVTCFSIVSKRCRELYLSTPSLDFDFKTTRTPSGEYKYFREATCEVRLNLLNSLDRFLLQRGDNKIEYFRLVWESHSVVEEDSDDQRDEEPCFCVNERFRIMTWIHNALRCNVEVLDVKSDVDYFEDEPYALFPSCVFLCAPLTSLAVEMNRTMVKTPSAAFSSNLVDLKLINVEIEDEGFFKWISCSCKFIKEIHLCHIRITGNIIIKSSSLEKFEYLEGTFTRSHIDISAEKLEVINIDWTFQSPGDNSLNIFAPKLKYFEWRGYLMNQANLGQLECLEKAVICLEPKADDSDKLIKHFYSLRRVELLVLNAATFKVSGFDKEYWKLQNLDFIDQIKEVTIVLDGSSNGIEFARYILENAKNLEQIYLQHLLDLPDDAIQKLNESKMSRATVNFEEDSEEDYEEDSEEDFEEDIEED
ncbi:F-box/LRR-repeat protein At3g58900-like isoform X2 [Pyrus x bretschneideri]|uniref:F-box/LRR-repeat protein At3g58900-like isoform X2 n=1 Tax=Pyrus x bretschneideri TaxID=225117 RepID=UPI0008706B34|nr:F-box/LRR-repeat protein At3g58900-like isoform X2 [Pyrus x bretschneideri]